MRAANDEINEATHDEEVWRGLESSFQCMVGYINFWVNVLCFNREN